jgi:hypothetical protein
VRILTAILPQLYSDADAGKRIQTFIRYGAASGSGPETID